MKLIKGKVYHLEYNSLRYIFRYSGESSHTISAYSYIYNGKFRGNCDVFHDKGSGTITEATQEQINELVAGERENGMSFNTNYSIF